MPLRMPLALLLPLLPNTPTEPLPTDPPAPAPLGGREPPGERLPPLETGEPLPPAPPWSSPAERANMSFARSDIRDDTPSTLEETPCGAIYLVYFQFIATRGGQEREGRV